jgi:hypothetical protein
LKSLELLSFNSTYFTINNQNKSILDLFWNNFSLGWSKFTSFFYSPTYLSAYIDQSSDDLLNSINFCIKNNIKIKINHIYDLNDVVIAHSNFFNLTGKSLIQIFNDDDDFLLDLDSSVDAFSDQNSLNSENFDNLDSGVDMDEGENNFDDSDN